MGVYMCISVRALAFRWSPFRTHLARARTRLRGSFTMDPDSRRGGPPTTCHQHIEHAPAAVASYLHKMCAKAAARSQATLSARLVLQQTYQAAISLHRAAFWHMLERLVTRIRRRSAFNRWHQTARARKQSGPPAYWRGKRNAKGPNGCESIASASAERLIGLGCSRSAV